MRKCLLMLASVLLIGIRPVGAGEAEYLVRGVQIPQSRAVNGFVQTVVPEGQGEWRVHVSCPATPIGSNSPAPHLAPMERVPENFVLPKTLLSRFSEAQSAWERGTEILRWVSTELQLKPQDPQPQDAVSVLERGSGRCSGVANATAALFMAAGYGARTISGLLVGEDGIVRHRWLEVNLPNAGWVPTDPTLGFWVVTPRYISFDETVELIPDVQILRASPPESPFAQFGESSLVRPDLGSKFRCRIVGACQDRLVGVLRDREGDERRRALQPEGVFSGLLPGRWVLEVLDGQRTIRKLAIDVKEGEDRSLALKVGCGDPS